MFSNCSLFRLFNTTDLLLYWQEKYNKIQQGTFKNNPIPLLTPKNDTRMDEKKQTNISINKHFISQCRHAQVNPNSQKHT